MKTYYKINTKLAGYEGEPVTEIKNKENFGTSFWVQNESGTRWYVNRDQLTELVPQGKPFSSAQVDGEKHEYLEPKTVDVNESQTDSKMLTPLEADKIVLQNACRVAYEKIQVLSMLNTTIAVLTDNTRATLRNALAEATNSDCETIQNEIEFDAYQQTKSMHKEKPILVNNISSSHINEMQELIDSIENDSGEIPIGIWKRIINLKTR